MRDEIGSLAEDISKQNVKGMIGFSLSLIVKHQKRDQLKKLLSKKKPELKDLENVQSVHIGGKKKRKKRKHVSKEH